MSKAPKQPEGLISVLLDSTAPLGDRDDAAMDLGAYNEPSVEDALLKIVLSYTEDEMIVDSAGESLWEICQRKGKHDPAIVEKMNPEARKFFSAK